VRAGPGVVPGYGWFAVIVDPTGAALGLWKPNRR
jgi:predicted enzyme related to lactoylglutathione lyase